MKIPFFIIWTCTNIVSRGSATNSNRSSTASTPNSGLGASRPLSDIWSSAREELPQLARTSAAPPRPEENSRDSYTLPPMRTFTTDPPITSSSVSFRASDSSSLPRRRSSVIYSPPASSLPLPLEQTATTTANATASNDPVPMDTTRDSSSNNPSAAATTRATVLELEARGGEDEDNPWRTIEDAMQLARGPLFESAGRAPPAPASPPPGPSTLTVPSSNGNMGTTSSAEPDSAELAASRARARSLAAQRERYRIRLLGEANAGTNGNNGNGNMSATAAALRRELRRGTADLPASFQDGYEMLSRRNNNNNSGRPTAAAAFASAALVARHAANMGIRTAGLAISQDGRKLWAACEEGIFEIDVNLKGRMFWPSIDMK